MGNIPLVVLIVIIANGIFSYQGFNDGIFFNKYKFHIGAIEKGEKLRFFSSAFLHGDWMHLIFNMYTLYMFGPIVAYKMGVINFLIIYIGSLLLGNLLSYYFHKNEYHYSAIGASGAVSGVLYAAIVLDPMMDLGFYFLPRNLKIPGYIFGIGYLLYSIYGMKSQRDNIGHDAHFGGAVGGYVLTLLIKPMLFQTQAFLVGILAVPIVALYFLVKSGKLNP